jgi:putative ABC transport system permease protein
VIGRSIDVGGEQGIIVGVLAPGFEMLFPPNTNVEPHPDVLAAARIDFDAASPNVAYLRTIAKLKPGVTIETAGRDAERLAVAESQVNPIMKAANVHYRLEPMHEDLVADVRPAIVALMGTVTFVLLISCANVANLLLVRGAAREREIAIRSALGASSSRIVQYLAAESIVLAIAGAVIGVALGWGAIRLLVALAPANVPRLDAVQIDPLVLGFVVVLSVVAAAIFGVMPAIRAARPDLAAVLRASGRTPGLGSGKRMRDAIVIAEVALAFVLLIGGGLMVRSFIALSRIDPGYDPRGVLTVTANPRPGSGENARAAFVRQMHERLSAIPGITDVTAVYALPLTGRTFGLRWGTEEAAIDASKFLNGNAHAVLPGYFAAMRTRLIAGRVFDASDNQSDRLLVVIDDRLARKAFPGQSPIGKRLYVRTNRSAKEDWVEVIGVVQRQLHDGLISPGREAMFFTDAFYHHGAVSTWVIRTECPATRACDAARVAPQVRRAIAEVDPQVPIADVQTMDAVVARAMTPTRFSLVLIDVFAGVAVLLSCIGLYSVLATAVRQRTVELGVRIALGATYSRIVRTVVGDGLRLSAIGLAIGLVVAVWLTRAMATMLVGVRATDPVTYAGTLVVFLGVAGVACWIPARRAARVDPITALRPE